MNTDLTQTQSPIPRPIAILAIIATHVAALTALMLVLVAIVPRYVKIFADFGTELPAVTHTLISISSLMLNYWYVILPLAAIVDAVIVWALASLDASQRWLLTAYSHLCLLGAIVVLVWTAITICVPTISLTEALRG